MEAMKITIVDDNNFFLLGLQNLLTAFFEKQNIKVIFIDKSTENTQVDIVFYCFKAGEIPKFCNFKRQLKADLYFSIMERNDIRSKEFPECFKEAAVFYRHEKPAIIMNIINNVISDGHEFMGLLRCYRCETESLTAREISIMRYMRVGLSHQAIARILHLHPKTISTHKLNVMKKMRFTRSTQLFYWLQNFGLNKQNEYKS